jgi:pimeloyl-ACP methyl ester carboxylesterase
MSSRTPAGTAYELAGPLEGPAVVLIHGVGLHRGIWQWHVPALAERYRVLTYDLPGHGESAPPAATPSLAVFGEQLRELLDHVGIAHAALVGFSLGGMINRHFALAHPDRVDALAVLNAPHERSPEEQARVEERARRVASGGSEATIEDALRRWFTEAFRERNADFLARVREWRAMADPASYAASVQVLAAGVPELVRPDPPIAQPTLVMTGEHDTGSTPAMARAIATEIAAARVRIVPGLQHLGLLERPEHFTGPVLEFLDTTIGARSAPRGGEYQHA